MKDKKQLIAGVNYWPGCGISFDELLIMLEKEPTMTKAEAREYLESHFNGDLKKDVK